MFSAGTHPHARLFVKMMVGTGIIGAAIVLVALYLMTTSLDRLATQRGNTALKLLLTDWTVSLSRSVEDYASSDLSTSLASASQPNIGGSFDWIAILDRDGKLINETNLPQQWNAAAYLASEAFQPVLDNVANGNSVEKAPVSGAFIHDSNHFLAAITRIGSRASTNLDAETPAFVIGGKSLSPSDLATISARLGSSNVSFTEETADWAVALNGPLGPTGFLTWEAEKLGLHFRKDTLPWVAMVGAIIVLLTAWMASYFHRLATKLEEMHKIATTDELTGVANRAALTEILRTRSLNDALKSGHCAIINIDLDDLKSLNDNHGHAVGDAALKIAAERIRGSLRQNDKVIRMGGDEFVCLVFDRNPMDAAQRVVNRLNLAFSTPTDLGGLRHLVTASIGVAISNGDEDWDTLFRRSDAEMYRTKRSGFEHELRFA